jgi:hypothetical protein
MNPYSDPFPHFLYDWQTLATGLLALFAALGTILATITIIRQGRKQHIDRFMPICILAPYDGIDAWLRRGKLVETNPLNNNDLHGTVKVFCVLRNVGVGPALKLRLMFRFLDMDGATTDPWELAPLAPNDAYGNDGKPLLIPIRIHDRFNRSDFDSLQQKSWQILLDYEDVFGNRFYTVHNRLLFDSKLEWLAGTGEQQKAAMPAIPWLTYGRGSSTNPSAR